MYALYEQLSAPDQKCAHEPLLEAVQFKAEHVSELHGDLLAQQLNAFYEHD